MKTHIYILKTHKKKVAISVNLALSCIHNHGPLYTEIVFESHLQPCFIIHQKHVDSTALVGPGCRLMMSC